MHPGRVDVTARNRQGARDHALFAAHRGRLAALIDEALPADARLCVLGAGNANDLELGALAGRAREVHLVDLDPEALARARARVTGPGRDRLFTHAPVDLAGGLVQAAARWRRRAPTADERAAALDTAAREVTERLPGGFDLVVSDCLLSQMCRAVAAAIGPTTLAAEDACALLGRAHLRAVTALARPGGAALLACDMSSTALVPELGAWEEGGLGEVATMMREVAAARRHSIGMNPLLLRRTLRDEEQAEDGRLHDPWLWRVSDDDVFLVFALSWRRRAHR